MKIVRLLTATLEKHYKNRQMKLKIKRGEKYFLAFTNTVKDIFFFFPRRILTKTV